MSFLRDACERADHDGFGTRIKFEERTAHRAPRTAHRAQRIGTRMRFAMIGWGWAMAENRSKPSHAIGFAAIVVSVIVHLTGIAAAQVPCQYELTHIIQGPICGGTGHPGSTVGTSISRNGRYVAGYWQCVTAARAFVFDTQTQQFTLLPHPMGITTSYAWGVNDAGLVVGELAGTSISFGFVFDTTIGQYRQQLTSNVATGRCVIKAINSSGTVCGFRTIEGPPLYRSSAFVWSAATGITDVGPINRHTTMGAAINEKGDVAGWFGSDVAVPGDGGFLFADGMVRLLPPISGGVSSQAYCLSNSGVVGGIGRVQTNDPPFSFKRGFLIDHGNMTIIAPESEYRHSSISCISDAGVVFGNSLVLPNNSNARKPFIWHRGVMRSLNELVPIAAGLDVDIVSAIDSRGRITGQGVKQGNVVSFVLSPLLSNPGDVTGNCVVNTDDLVTVIAEWGKSESVADINGDGVVDAQDLLVVIQNWSSS